MPGTFLSGRLLLPAQRPFSKILPSVRFCLGRSADLLKILFPRAQALTQAFFHFNEVYWPLFM